MKSQLFETFYDTLTQTELVPEEQLMVLRAADSNPKLCSLLCTILIGRGVKLSGQAILEIISLLESKISALNELLNNKLFKDENFKDSLFEAINLSDITKLSESRISTLIEVFNKSLQNKNFKDRIFQEISRIINIDEEKLPYLLAIVKSELYRIDPDKYVIATSVIEMVTVEEASRMTPLFINETICSYSFDGYKENILGAMTNPEETIEFQNMGNEDYFAITQKLKEKRIRIQKVSEKFGIME